MDLAEVERVIRAMKPAKQKEELPLLKFAEFGNKTSPRGCLRRDANVTTVTGIEGDYDDEKMPMSDAVALLQAKGVAALFYTSARHEEPKPRWRVVCPLATPLTGTPDELRVKRAHYVGILNAILGGVLASESFKLSQCFYFGPIKGKPAPQIVRLEGICIDQFENPPAPVFPKTNAAADAAHPSGSGATDTELRDGLWRGEDRHECLVSYSARLIGRGMTKADAIATLHPLLDGPAGSVSRSGIDYHTRVEQYVDQAIRKFSDRRETPNVRAQPTSNEAPVNAAKPPPERKPLDWATLQGQQVPQRDWVITHWIPNNHPALLAGKAGIGKTLLAQHLATALVRKHEYVGRVPKARRVLFWAGEDDHNELWRRQLAICKHFDMPLAALGDAFILHSYVGVDITLAAPVFGSLAPTPMMEELREQVHDYKADVVILDNAARIYGSNESDRNSVTRMLAWLQGACGDAAVLLLAHPAKAQGSEYSGSTAWEASVRTRLYLTDRLPEQGGKTEEDEGEIPDPGVRYLMRRKANYASEDVVRFDLLNGVLVPETVTPGHTLSALTDTDCEDIVVRALAKLTEWQHCPNAGAGSPSYLPTLAIKFKLLERSSIKNFTAAMVRLMKANVLKVEVVGKYSNRSPRNGLVYHPRQEIAG